MKAFIWLAVFLTWLTSASIVSAQVIISEVYPNPNSEETEWVELFNNSDSVIFLENWQLWDQESKPSLIFQFTDETIDSNKYLVIPLKSVLNNSGDTVIIYDDQQIIQDSLTYLSSKKDYSWSKNETTGEVLETLPTPNNINISPEPSLTPSSTPAPIKNQPSSQPQPKIIVPQIKNNTKEIIKPKYPDSIINLEIDIPKTDPRLLQSIYFDPPDLERGAIGVIISSLLLLVPGLAYVKKQELL
jgi:hypothetical protein